MNNVPSLEELRHELMVAIGAAVLQLQFFELYASGCLLALFPDERYHIEGLMSGDRSRRGPTLSNLVSKLKECMPIEPRFEARLGAFIENRNILVHRLFISDIGPKTQEAEAALYEKLAFILALMEEADALKPAFSGLYSLIHKAQLARGHIQSTPELEQYAAEMEEYENEILSVLRFKRDNQT